VTPASIAAAANAQEAFSVTVATSASDARRAGLFARFLEPKGASPTGVRFLLGLIVCGFCLRPCESSESVSRRARCCCLWRLCSVAWRVVEVRRVILWTRRRRKRTRRR
jgi:hypothetical protein